jgi:transportin-3
MGTEWPKVVPDLVTALTRSPDLAVSLFSILEILPEESANYHSTSRVSKEAVAAFRAQIRSAAPEMIRNLGNPSLLGNSKDVNAQAQIMRCFANWLRVCEDAQVATALAGNQLVVSAFDALGSQDLFESALSAVCELVLVSTQNELRQLMEYAVSRAKGYLSAFKA